MTTVIELMGTDWETRTVAPDGLWRRSVWNHSRMGILPGAREG